MTQSPVIILGMHRSGTSCLSGSLEEAGLFLGEVKRQNRDNLKGNRESPAIMALHKRLMADNGADWADPPREEVAWSDEHRVERDQFLAAYPADGLWGFKDPRTVFTLSGWLEALPDARLVGSIRHPMAVARSLQLRNDFPMKKGLALWRSYNRRLLAICKERRVRLVDFDSPSDRYDRALRVVCRELGLAAPERFTFFESGLRTNSGADSDALPENIAKLYGALSRRAAKTPDAL